MKRFAALCTGFAFVVAGLAIVRAEETPSIETVMKKLHGKTGSHKVIGKALDAEEVKWDDIVKHAKLYADLSASLEKSTPEKGDKKSWDKLSKEYAKDAKGLSEAAGKKDKDGVKTAFGKLKESCDACHEHHRD